MTAGSSRTPARTSRPHIPVMVSDVLELLAVKSPGLYVDATVGPGGHTRAIAEHSAPEGIVVGLDRDGESVALARQDLASFGDRVRLAQGRFSRLGKTLEGFGYSEPAADGILADLGLSTWQLKHDARGFSFGSGSPPDMRMDRQAGKTALTVLESLGEDELAKLLAVVGEEPLAKRFARAITEALERGELRSSRDLSRVVELSAGPNRVRNARTHVATRTFMALRIAVNDELEELDALLEQAPRWLRPGGRMAVLTYHSLEDRRVKDRFRRLERPERDLPEGLPLKEAELPRGRYRRVTARPVTPSAEEVARNPSSRSAKLRVLERKGI